VSIFSHHNYQERSSLVDAGYILALLTPVIAWVGSRAVWKAAPKLNYRVALLVPVGIALCQNLVMGLLGMQQLLAVQLLLGTGAIFIDQMVKAPKGS